MPKDTDLEQFMRLFEEELREQKYNKLAYMWPSEGRYARQHYPKHMELITASGKYHELFMLGGNGAGKSMFGAAFTAILTTGKYPEWWDGYVVNGPVTWWVSGVTNDEIRTSTQKYLLGDVAALGDEALGSGLIPREDIIEWKRAVNGNGLCDYAVIRNWAGAGGKSTIRFKSYKEGRETYQAETLHGAWDDEEAPVPIHGEIMQRFRGPTAEGRLLTTFTPLKGMTELATKALDWRDANAKEKASRYTVVIGQREVPHMTDDEVNRRLAAAPAHERKARETGMPYVGSGLIYPVAEDQFVVPPCKLPDHCRKAFGLDDGWHATAVVWGAYDEDTDILYIYSEYKEGELPVDVHATRIRARGTWIPGVGDSSARDRDGKQIITKYRESGIRLRLPNKASGSVGAGIEAVLERLTTGRLKVFSTCIKLIEEMRKYRRETRETAFSEHSEIVKKDDHLCDALRYLVVDGIKIASTQRRVEIDIPQVRFG
jgi:phage terminase large subunit-like protein